MSTKDVTGKLEALLFVSDEAVSVADLALLIEEDKGTVADALAALQSKYAHDERGFQLREIAGGWRLYTNPVHHHLIESFVLSWDTRKLSQAALEALAVVAYRQPVTRAGVNAIRGVNSEGVMSSLLEKGLIREMGRDKVNNNAMLYGTTKTFLERLGLKDIESLPPFDQFAPQQSVSDAIRTRLDATLTGFDRVVDSDEADERDAHAVPEELGLDQRAGQPVADEENDVIETIE